MMIFAVFSGLFIYSCVKKPSYSSTPVISYNNFFRYGVNASDPDSIVLAINFQDEEGDIGLDQSDMNGVFKYGNLWLVYYYDSANVYPYYWCPFDTSVGPLTPFDTLKIPFRVPVVLPQNETSQPMKGIIYAKLNRMIIRPLPSHKTIMYQIYLYDRAMHKSNVVLTPVYVF